MHLSIISTIVDSFIIAEIVMAVFRINKYLR